MLADFSITGAGQSAMGAIHLTKAACCADKDWYEQPSLMAQPGQVVGNPIDFCKTVYRNVITLAANTISMETATVLELRGILAQVQHNTGSHIQQSFGAQADCIDLT